MRAVPVISVPCSVTCTELGMVIVETPLFSENNLVPHFIETLIHPGEHEIRIETPGKPKYFQNNFICKAGEALHTYPALNVHMDDSAPRKIVYEGEIFISNTPIEGLQEHQRLLFYNGQWLGH